MAIKTTGRKLNEAEMNAPDLDDGQLDVEHYPLPDGSTIEDPYVRAVWEEAVAGLGEAVGEEPIPFRRQPWTLESD